MIRYLSETGSTNADAAERLRAGELVPDGVWFVADRQTAGKGRHGREWFDGSGNFMGSTVVPLRFGDPQPASLALVAGLAVHATVRPLVPSEQDLRLKWPNDLLAGDAKLAGILLEREADAVIVGIGVNLAVAPALDRATTSIAAMGGNPDRDSFAASLRDHFAAELDRWRTYGLSPIVNRWLAVGHELGTPLSVGLPGEEPVYGLFVGLSADGALQLRLEDGTTRVIHSGEVHLARS